MPSLVPTAGNGEIYFVLCDYGAKWGRVYVETDPDQADRETITENLIRGEYNGPVKVLAVDIAAGRARDASADIAEEILERTPLDDLQPDVQIFVSLRTKLRI